MIVDGDPRDPGVTVHDPRRRLTPESSVTSTPLEYAAKAGRIIEDR
jgi:hypothetical protein